MKRYVIFLSTLFVGVMVSGLVLAAEAEAAASAGGFDIKPLAIAIIMAAASAVGTNSQSRAAAAALEGISRNPQAAGKVQTPLILSLAFMESLVIFALLTTFLM